MLEPLTNLLPSAATIVAVVCLLWAANRLLEKNSTKHIGTQFRNQMLMIALTFAGLLVIILVVPIGNERRGQLLSLLGILLTAAIALSSTTVLGNGMAGLMLRAVKNFGIGDFIRCGDHFGRVTERGLVHTEIQTENRRLTTLPNLYLVTHPLTKIRNSGTVIATRVSLGYDVSRLLIERLLIRAAEQCGLNDAFVQIKDLGDFSVTYRVAGMLTEVKHLITAESRLRGAVLDEFHGNGVEIVSPTFMNQRVLAEGLRFVPAATPKTKPQPIQGDTPEKLVFDKADEAETIEALRQRRAGIVKQIDELSVSIKKAEGDEKDRMTRELKRLEGTVATLKRVIGLREERTDND